MKELSATNAMRVVGKEVLVGGINGVLFAILSGVVAWFWFENIGLGLVIAMAMVVNMLVAGIAGTTIPLFLERLGADPAVASSVFLTTITDVVGFAAFLGLAAVFLL
jgi:magnesium transporter